MSTITQSAVHRIGKWTDAKFNKKPSSQAQHNTPTQNAPGNCYCSSQPAWQQPSPRTLELRPQGHTMVCESEYGPLLTITFTSNSIGDDKAPHLIALRGNAAGPQIASARFHQWTSTKTDLELHGRATKVRRELHSATGLGKIKWERDGTKGMKLSAHHSGDERSGKEVIARFGAAHKSKRNRGAGQFDLLREGMSTPQLEEIVVSCLVERERMRRAGELVEDGIWELFMASIGL
ncbi:hypothetical protein E8E14_005380 [Neopestalotiopsis sp. 37M]|nr:hypothetical protein E8E14_005380 [Neopestalotiopsis sp. 37M]